MARPAAISPLAMLHGWRAKVGSPCHHLNWSQGGIYILGVMKISLSDLVKTLLPYLYDDLVPTPDLRHMRISPWL